MEIKDNRAEIRKTKEVKAVVCRVCGSEIVHSEVYGRPTMKCVEYLRAIITQLEDRNNELDWALNPDRMGQ